MRERRKASDESTDDAEEWEVWRPPTFPFGGLIGSNAPSMKPPAASYRSRKSPGVKPRWTQDDVDRAQRDE